MARSRSKGKKTEDAAPQLASEVIKRYASKQRIRIKLTPEQMEEILKQWNEKDPIMPAEITFHVGRKEVANLKVAGYRYRGDTCCV